ncbi:hypothetical protein TPENAI_30075 [Tenacibaculum litopenaei]|uniref:eCIS core domain-containing protein n=1 Tax=Tenacibaculum litopenaei TaxID=396016 RepID=UPI0038960773
MSSLRESKSQKPTVAPPSKKQAQTVQLQSNNQFHQRQQDTQESIDSSPKMGAMQLKARQIPTAPIQRQINNTGLPDQLKSGIEQLSGLDMSDTRVHYNSAKPAQLQAHAYAQGTDIHLAPGQEKHLAHEAWHVVQQKQGRVKATTQLKGKTPINDDAGLEREADVMGAKALQMRTDTHAPLQRKSISSNAQPVQRYSVVQDDAGTVYNKSNNGHFLVGLGYPNHELYIRDTGMIDALNNNLDASLLRFTNAGARSISFNDTAERYYKVMPIHKTQGDNAIDTDALDVGIRNTLVNNLAKKQYRTQLDATNSYNNETFDADFEAQYDKEAKTQEFTTNTGPAENVYEFKMKTEFIRKSLSQLGYTDKGDDTIERVKGEFILVYQVINRYFKGGANKTDVAQALQLFTNSFPFVSVNPLLIKVMETTGEMQNFLQHIPDTSSTHLVNKGHLNRQLAQQGRGELLLPRGCDIVAGTTMGKPTDMDTPMPFSMRFFMNSHSDDHTHFSTKIFADDTDFVTIEGFAASGLNVFDDTWEFFLHGDRLEEDDAFFQYTMSRYDFFDFKADFMRRYNDASEA